MFPEIIQIETSNFCPGKCSFCNAVRDDHLQLINEDLFCKIIHECKGKNITYRLFLHNEPLSDPLLVDRIRLIKKDKSAKVELNSNGILLTEDISEKLIQSEIDSIKFSIDGFYNQSVYKNRGFNRKVLYKNIEYFLNLNQSLNSKIYTEVRMIKDLAQDKMELQHYESHWKGLVDKVVFTELYHWSGSYCGPTIYKPCPKPQREMFIKINGDVLLCCWDWKNLGPTYSVQTDKIVNVWNSLNRYRKHLKKGNRDCCVLCQKCNAYE